MTVRDIDLQVVADHRETFMNTSMGCVVHETRENPGFSFGEGTQFISNNILINRMFLSIVVLFDPPHHPLSWHAKLYAELRSPDGEKKV